MRRATSKLSLLLYFVLATLFVAGYVARYVHPRHAWWLQLVAIGLPFVGAVIAGISIPVFLSRNRKTRYLRRLHAVLLVLLVVRFPPWVLLGSGTAAETDMRLLTYNAPGLETEPDQDLTLAMRNLVDATDPHVMTLQEVYWRYAFGRKGISGRPDVVRLVTDSDYTDAPDSIARRIFTRQPVFSRVGIESVELLSWEVVTDPIEPLEVIKAVTAWDGRRFTIFNIHLASYGVQKPWLEEESRRLDPWVWRGYLSRYRRAILRRAWEAEVIRELMESEDGPFLVAGDFNATPHNWTYRHVAAGYRDAMIDAGRGTGFTYHRRRPIARIDFVIGSRHFRFTSAEVVDGRTSDHLGLLVNLRWRDR